MNLLLRKRCEFDEMPHKPATTRYWYLASLVKRQAIGPFTICTLYLSIDEWDIWIE